MAVEPAGFPALCRDAQSAGSDLRVPVSGRNGLGAHPLFHSGDLGGGVIEGIGGVAASADQDRPAKGSRYQLRHNAGGTQLRVCVPERCIDWCCSSGTETARRTRDAVRAKNCNLLTGSEPTRMGREWASLLRLKTGLVPIQIPHAQRQAPSISQHEPHCEP